MAMRSIGASMARFLYLEDHIPRSSAALEDHVTFAFIGVASQGLSPVRA